MEKTSLLSACTSGGCGAKIGAGELVDILAKLNAEFNETKSIPLGNTSFAGAANAVGEKARLLVGFDGRDDAAVYQLDEATALVSTVDFFPPMVEDPYLFGMIAATNSLSDVYAMGGRPLFALNLVCFPEKLDKAILGEILSGGAAKAMEAGALIAGGHSIYDHEPKYGLAVTGVVDPKRLLKNDGCREGDALILTKALGVGLVMAAFRDNAASQETVKAATDSMVRLNRYAAEKVIAANGVHACTDVTGFGLAAHASEMAAAKHTLVIDSASLHLLPGALRYAEEGYVTGGGGRNRRFMEGKVDISALSPFLSEIVFDPQTSGGLLIAVASEAASELCDAIRVDDPAAAIIGKVTARKESCVIIA